jgi:gamma-glutamylcyclotransferase (GGCT)/AIG2-like uncharacterized protein YtfP
MRQSSFMETPMITLFVYGTLKRGGSNHAAYCGNAVGIKPGRVLGRLWMLPAGFPILEVPRGLRLAEGSSDYVSDALLSGPYRAAVWPPTPELPMRWIEGELMTFLEPRQTLHEMDELESYSPGRPSLYARALVAVHAHDGSWLSAWCYVAPHAPEADWQPHAEDSWP